MRTNTKAPRKVPAESILTTHEGAPAHSPDAYHQLRRSVLACLLWEREFYEDGHEISTRIRALAAQVRPSLVASLAIYARHSMHLRHVPLLLLREVIRHPDQETVKLHQLVTKTLPRVISRADELTEFLALYWASNDGKKTLTRQLKRGLARAFFAFDEYQLAKYDRGTKVKLRDVMRLSHPKPNTEARAALWHRLMKQQLATPDTWEVALTTGEDKRTAFERLLRSRKLGYFALLRNLRNMVNAGVDRELVEQAISERRGAQDVLPFRFIAAARAAPTFEPVLDQAMQATMQGFDKLPGMTLVLVDTSPSMRCALSERSDLTRVDASCGVAILARGVCERVRVFAFSNECAEVPARSGMALAEAIGNAVPSNGTYLGKAVTQLNAIDHDRLIVITDEQSHDRVPQPACARAYMINVASARNGVGYGPWTHLDGFSEGLLRWIPEHELALDERAREP